MIMRRRGAPRRDSLCAGAGKMPAGARDGAKTRGRGEKMNGYDLTDAQSESGSVKSGAGMARSDGGKPRDLIKHSIKTIRKSYAFSDRTFRFRGIRR